MFPLADLRKTRVWQEIHEEGMLEGEAKGEAKGKDATKREWVGKWLAKGMSQKEIAALLEVPVSEVRRLAKSLSAPTRSTTKKRG